MDEWVAREGEEEGRWSLFEPSFVCASARVPCLNVKEVQRLTMVGAI